MVSYDWANGVSVGVFFRHGMVSGLWGELVLFQGMDVEFEDKIVLQSCREGYCEYGRATGISCWVYHLLGELYLARLSGLMSSKADRFPGGETPNFDIVNSLSKRNGGRDRRPNFVFWVAGSVLSASVQVAMAWRKVLYRAS